MLCVKTHGMLTIMSSRVTDRRELGRLVRERRRARSLTQADLAAAAGVGRGVLQKLETGRGEVTVTGVLAILSALSLDVDLVEREMHPGGR
jgi:transcriptional regulator with XRE-family HTH domain